MTSTAALDIDSTELHALTQGILDVLLGPAGGEPAEAAGADETLAAVVTLFGDRQAALILRTDRPFASQLASAMFGVAPGELTGADVEDALGELANIVAGPVKASLAGEWTLGLPSVTSGVGHRVEVPGAVAVCAASCEAFGRTLTVELVAKDPGGAVRGG